MTDIVHGQFTEAFVVSVCRHEMSDPVRLASPPRLADVKEEEGLNVVAVSAEICRQKNRVIQHVADIVHGHFTAACIVSVSRLEMSDSSRLAFLRPTDACAQKCNEMSVLAEICGHAVTCPEATTCRRRCACEAS